MKNKMYISIQQNILVNFLIENNLADQYIETLPENESCIGCSRDEGDHDGECPLTYDQPPEYWTTSKPYRKQIEDLYRFYLKKK